MLYLNGQSLVHKSTSFRKRNMRGCLKEIKGRVEFAVEYKGKTAKDVRQRMDEVMAERYVFIASQCTGCLSFILGVKGWS